MRKPLSFFLAAFLICSLQAQQVQLAPYGYKLNPPIGWTLMDASDPNLVSFTDPQRRAVFQVAVFPKNQFPDAKSVILFAKERFKAAGDEAPFVFNGTNGYLADYTFKASAYPARGYFMSIQGDPFHYLLAGFAPEQFYSQYHDFLLSLLDSFSIVDNLAPGPVSQFYRAFPDPEQGKVSLRVENNQYPVSVGTGEIEANSVMIEREARILATYTRNPSLFPKAWQRYYQLIYRDTYSRIKPLAETLSHHYRSQGVPREALPAKLLSWIQGFTYTRPSTFSDLASPVEAGLTATGDCDARALLYIIILKHWGFDAILLVSHTYQHAIAAVDVPGPGARYSFGGKQYLVAELTDKVAIGLINRKMADPAGWIPIAFF